MNKRRLLKLADLLEADAKNKEGVKFSLYCWGETTSKDDVVSCGTAACAVGLAGVSGAFKKQGLGYRLKPIGVSDDGITRYEIQITLDGKCRSTGDYDGSFINSMKFFGLTMSAAEWLFIPLSYPGLPKVGAEGELLVAKRIRDFVAGKAHL